MRCPRCGGNVAVSREDDGPERYCLACGWRPLSDVRPVGIVCSRCGQNGNSKIHKQTCRTVAA